MRPAELSVREREAVRVLEEGPAAATGGFDPRLEGGARGAGIAVCPAPAPHGRLPGIVELGPLAAQDPDLRHPRDDPPVRTDGIRKPDEVAKGIAPAERNRADCGQDRLRLPLPLRHEVGRTHDEDAEGLRGERQEGQGDRGLACPHLPAEVDGTVAGDEEGLGEGLRRLGLCRIAGPGKRRKGGVICGSRPRVAEGVVQDLEGLGHPLGERLSEAVEEFVEGARHHAASRVGAGSAEH